jgi:phosphoglycolate phosphatase
MSGAVKSLVLDLDGTLIDSKPAIFESFGVASARVMPGQPLSMDGVTVGPPLPEMFRRQFPAASPAQIDELVRTFREHYASRGIFTTRMFDSAPAVLDACRERNIALYIATNKPLRLTQAILDNLKITPLFAAVLAADSTQPPFPNKAAMIRHLLEQHRFDASEAVYVGDTAEDAEAASACGLRFVWASYGYGQLTPEQVKSAFCTIGEFGELAALLQ